MFLDKPITREPGSDDDVESDAAELVTIADFFNGVALALFSLDDEGDESEEAADHAISFDAVLARTIAFTSMLRERHASRLADLEPFVTDDDREWLEELDAEILHLEWMRETPVPTTTAPTFARLFDALRIDGKPLMKRPCKLCGRTIWYVPLATRKSPAGDLHPVTDDGESHFKNCPKRARE